MELNYIQSCLLKDLRKEAKTLANLEKTPSRISLLADIEQLIAKGLVDTRPLDDRILYCCTEQGRELADKLLEKALQDWQRPTPARTIPIPKEVYNPNDRQYGQFVRNGGNKHILSRGL